MAKTSESYAAIEYPGATVTESFLTKSGLSVTGVTRMLPALAAWVVSKRQPAVLSIGGKKYDVLDLAGSALVNGTNPDHKDYWQAARKDGQDQRQVEASLVAWSAWLLRDTLLPQMSSTERRRLDEWLASCTVFPVRRNNWAWFTAINHAARMALKDRFDEFSYNQTSMFEDLRALSNMHAGNGWYRDGGPDSPFDYYNSWTFASHFLYWDQITGGRFEDWSAMFGDRLRQYLDTAPLFFGANGAHILYGRSLIYRWAVLTPMVLAYVGKRWPHDPATLQRIVQGNLNFHWNNGAFDRENGKLRETWSGQGTVDIRENYIDGGHPYWAMQAFAMMLIPRDDAFWTSAGGQLPVERADFVRPINAPGLLLSGTKNSGQVKMLQSRSTNPDWHYRDKYNKLVYSSHFPMNIVQREDVCPWDNALVLRDKRKRRSGGRGPFESSRLLPDGMEASYSIVYGGVRATVRSTILLDGEFELRIHRVIGPAEADPSIELVEGSSVIGTDEPEDLDHLGTETSSVVRNKKTRVLIASWLGSGWAGIGASWDFGFGDTAASNLVFPRMEVNTLWAPLKVGTQVLHSVHYASPAPLTQQALTAGASRLFARARALAAPAPPPRRHPAGRSRL